MEKGLGYLFITSNSSRFFNKTDSEWYLFNLESSFNPILLICLQLSFFFIELSYFCHRIFTENLTILCLELVVQFYFGFEQLLNMRNNEVYAVKLRF